MHQKLKVAPFWIFLGAFVGLPVLLVAISIGHSAFRARRPNDMPSSSIWIDAPAAPFNFYHGWWQGCWIEPDQKANHCRLYGPGLSDPTVYEGRFLPCGQNAPVPVSGLNLRPPYENESMWIFPRFVVYLKDGRILVPIEDIKDCESLLSHGKPQ